MLKLWKNSFSSLKDLEKREYKLPGALWKKFQEEWIIKLYSKINCGLMPDI